MITATCSNDNCKLEGINYAMYGEPKYVQCGACGQPTAISNPQPDPPVPDEEAPQ